MSVALPPPRPPPRHIAIIMDGNGRWAKRRHLPRIEGHRRGADSAREIIRTAGELRISNYLLWQISYAELVVTPRLWPDFTESDFHDALRQFAQRNRRFGALDHTNTLTK